jgi:hypothetical protein
MPRSKLLFQVVFGPMIKEIMFRLMVVVSSRSKTRIFGMARSGDKVWIKASVM